LRGKTIRPPCAPPFPCIPFSTHTHVHAYLYIISLFPSYYLLPRHHRKHLMVVSCRENEESATEFLPLSQIPASLASSSSSSLERKKWLDDGRRDKRSQSRASGFLSLANRYSVLSIVDARIYLDLRYGLRVTHRHVGLCIRALHLYDVPERRRESAYG